MIDCTDASDRGITIFRVYRTIAGAGSVGAPFPGALMVDYQSTTLRFRTSWEEPVVKMKISMVVYGDTCCSVRYPSVARRTIGELLYYQWLALSDHLFMHGGTPYVVARTFNGSSTFT